MKRSALEASLPTDEAARRAALLRMLTEQGDDEEEESDDDDDDDDDDDQLPELDRNRRVIGYSGIDHGCRSWERALPLGDALTSELTRDCRLVFTLDSSNWLAAGTAPRCSLEALARAVFERHTAHATYDAETSGCEWWAQVRTSGDKDEAIEFHWDCDEYACDRRGVHVCPALSTVTYLSDVGAPTLVLDVPAPPTADAPLDPSQGAIGGGTLSYPKRGKHLVFDGRHLHGAVPTRTERAGDVRRGATRVSFLVNVWLNHRPRGIESLPAELLPQLSKSLLVVEAPSRSASAGSSANDDDTGSASPLRSLRAADAAADVPAIAHLGGDGGAYNDDGGVADGGSGSSGDSGVGGGDGNDLLTPPGFEGGHTLEVSFGRNANAHALRVPLPPRGLRADGTEGAVDHAVVLRFGPRKPPFRPAAEVCTNVPSRRLTPAPKRARETAS